MEVLVKCVLIMSLKTSGDEEHKKVTPESLNPVLYCHLICKLHMKNVNLIRFVLRLKKYETIFFVEIILTLKTCIASIVMSYTYTGVF